MRNNQHLNAGINVRVTSASRSSQTTPQPIVIIPDSPPPTYVSLRLDDTSHVINIDETDDPLPSTADTNGKCLIFN